MHANPELAPNFKPLPMNFREPPVEEIAGIYKGIGELVGIKEDLQGWNSTAPIFRRLIEQVQPQVIIEIGGWKGASTVHMVHTALDMHLDPLVFTVDFWQDPILHTAESMIPRPWCEGFTAYQQFLYNVWVNRCDCNVIPIRTWSPHGAPLLAVWGVKADLIYVDGDHSYEGCLRDLTLYWPLLAPGGVMFGDDIMEPGVTRAVNQFTQGLKVTHDEHHWQLPPKL